MTRQAPKLPNMGGYRLGYRIDPARIGTLWVLRELFSAIGLGCARARVARTRILTLSSLSSQAPKDISFVFMAQGFSLSGAWRKLVFKLPDKLPPLAWGISPRQALRGADL